MQLGNPARLTLFRTLQGGEHCACALVEAVGQESRRVAPGMRLRKHGWRTLSMACREYAKGVMSA